MTRDETLFQEFKTAFEKAMATGQRTRIAEAIKVGIEVFMLLHSPGLKGLTHMMLTDLEVRFY